MNVYNFLHNNTLNPLTKTMDFFILYLEINED